MIKSTFKKVFNQSLNLLICILLIISTLHGAVLCIGEDGHIAIEAAGSDCCGSLPSDRTEAGFAKAAFSSEAQKCGSCLDVPISPVTAVAVKKPNPVNSTPSTSTTFSTLNIGDCDFSKYHLASNPPDLVNPCLTHLSSIILLI